jgi:hypothetical protein
MASKICSRLVKNTRLEPMFVTGNPQQGKETKIKSEIIVNFVTIVIYDL